MQSIYNTSLSIRVKNIMKRSLISNSARWDVSGMDNLPTTLKICFLAIYNMGNEIGYWAMKEHGFNVIPYIHKMVINAHQNMN